MESVKGRPAYGAETKKHVLERLTAAEGMENYLRHVIRALSGLASKAAKA